MVAGLHPVAIAFVHHANQYVITDGYDNRPGISEVVGELGMETGLRRVLELHRRYEVPLNVHISGTLLEALAWERPEFLSELSDLAQSGQLELIGSSYGQNMMRFFSREHNSRQLSEGLVCYRRLLNWPPQHVRVFWVPERLWDSPRLVPVLTNARLPNGGYRYVILDDRLLYPRGGTANRRRTFDHRQSWDPTNFFIYRIKDGNGLCVLPIATNLRHHIPPRTEESFVRVQAQLTWLSDVSAHYDCPQIAIYADDMEKVGGVGWDPSGPSQYERVLRWVRATPWLVPVKIGAWAARHAPADEKAIEPGTYLELVNEFEAGEDYQNWYGDERWAPYRGFCAWADQRVRELAAAGADSTLIELAWKVLLATSWQTAWHTPRTGAHGEPNSSGGPSAWVCAIASHSRLAATIAEAAHWMTHKDALSHAYLQDLDHDGHEELIFKNDALFAVFSPPDGGRLVCLFSLLFGSGCMVVGNPIDDWNLQEELHQYMEQPPNHPGALSDVGCERDAFETTIQTGMGPAARATLRNITALSPSFGLQKAVSLAQSENELCVTYTLPDRVEKWSVEIGFSPDYLQLLRDGGKRAHPIARGASFRGWRNGDLVVWAKLGDGSTFWDTPRQGRFGHGYLLRATSSSQTFSISIGVTGR